MVASLLRWLMPAALCFVAGAAAAQTPPPAAAKPDPLDPGASVPTVAYVSVFSRYRRTADDNAIPWREANDTAARIGGWRVYAREAQQPDPAASAPAATPAQPATKAMPMPQGHGGHKMP
jgi:hypothetical protein